MKPTPNVALKVAIVRAGLKQRQIAHRARIHESRFSAIVRGRLVPSEREQVRIASILAVSVNEVFPETVSL